jgi:hypothetical protein
MPTYTGDQGIVKVGPTPTDIVELKRFSVNVVNAPIEDTAKGDSWDTFKAGRNRWTAEVAVHYDPDATTEQNSMTIGAELAFEFYFIGETTGDEYRSGSGIIIDEQLNSDEGNVIAERVFQIQGSGALTEAAAP